MTMYIVLSAFTSSLISLLATTEVSVFYSIVCMLPPNILIPSAYTRNRWVPFNLMLSCFTWTLLMAYSKIKLKSNSLFQTIFNRKHVRQILPTWPLLEVSFRHIFLALPVCWGYQIQCECCTRSHPNWIVGILEVNKADTLFHCITIFSWVFYESRRYDQ